MILKELSVFVSPKPMNRIGSYTHRFAAVVLHANQNYLADQSTALRSSERRFRFGCVTARQKPNEKVKGNPLTTIGAKGPHFLRYLSFHEQGELCNILEWRTRKHIPRTIHNDVRKNLELLYRLLTLLLPHSILLYTFGPT